MDMDTKDGDLLKNRSIFRIQIQQHSKGAAMTKNRQLSTTSVPIVRDSLLGLMASMGVGIITAVVLVTTIFIGNLQF